MHIDKYESYIYMCVCMCVCVSLSDSESLDLNGKGHSREYKSDTDLFPMTARVKVLL